MTRYYVSRAVISLALGALLLITGLPWWMSAFGVAAIFAYFLWAARSGRFAVRPELGVTALRHDERTEAIRDRSVRTAFVTVMLVLAAVVLYAAMTARAQVPVSVINLVLLLGILTYVLMDAWQRRA